MNRTQKISLSLICALALVLFPLSYSSWAQSTTTQQNQAGQADRNSTDQNQDLNKNTDQNKSNQNSVDQDRDLNKNSDQNVTREKSSPSTTTEPSATQQNYDQNKTQSPSNSNRSNMGTTNSENSTSTESESTSTTTTEQNSADQKGLPRTAGELPLIALIGLLSFAAAAGTRVLSGVKSR
jgi:hypothetical protein